jgi:hypothetical protein
LSSFATLPTPQLGFTKVGSQQQQQQSMSSAAQQPISAGMSRTAAFDNKQPQSMAAMQGPPMTTTPAGTAVPMMASSAGLTAADRDKIRQVAEFCANKGVAKLKSLKENPEAKTIMPFLFEGNPGHEEFMSILKSLVGLAANQPPPTTTAAPTAPVTTTPMSPMGQGMSGPSSQSRFSQAPYQQQQQPTQQGGSYYGPPGGGGGGGGQNYQNRDSSSSNYYSNTGNSNNNNPQQRRGSRFG